MQEIGTLLKNARQEKNITLEQINKDTNIASRYLDAIEQGEYDIFPGEPYLIGFLRNYAEYLGLNPDECIKLYKNAKMQETTIPTEILVPKKSFSIPRGIIILLISILLIALVFFIGNTILKKIRTDIQVRTNNISKETEKIEAQHNSVYTLSNTLFEKRLFIGDTVQVTIDEKKYELKVIKTAPELHLETAIGTQVIALGQNVALDLNGDVTADVKISVTDLDKSDETKGALVEMATAELIEQPINTPEKIKEDIVVSENTNPQTTSTKHKVLFDAGYAYPVTLNAVFRTYCLFRYEQDRGNRQERYYQKSEQLTIQANNAIRVWASNGNAVKMQIIAGGKTVDIEVTRPGEVIVKDLKWIKDDETNRYKFVILDVD